MVVENGDFVKLEFEGKLEDGTVFDSSKHEGHSHPIEFEVGAGKVLKGLDDAVRGMEKGEKKEIEISPEEGYGARNEVLKKEIPKSSVPKSPEGRGPQKGMILTAQSPQGESFPMLIDEVKEDVIVLDLNHPLAGKKLIFEIEVVDIKKPVEESPSS